MMATVYAVADPSLSEPGAIAQVRIILLSIRKWLNHRIVSDKAHIASDDVSCISNFLYGTVEGVSDSSRSACPQMVSQCRCKFCRTDSTSLQRVSRWRGGGSPEQWYNVLTEPDSIFL